MPRWILPLVALAALIASLIALFGGNTALMAAGVIVMGSTGLVYYRFPSVKNKGLAWGLIIMATFFGYMVARTIIPALP